jgi:hypothetical protein
MFLVKWLCGEKDGAMMLISLLIVLQFVIVGPPDNNSVNEPRSIVLVFTSTES